MVLIFLLSLAFLTYAILGELEKMGETPQPPSGTCPGCARTLEADWLLCPFCRTLVREKCAGCGHQRASYHDFCPLCGADDGGKGA